MHIDLNEVELSFTTRASLAGSERIDAQGLTFWGVTIEVVPLDENPDGRRRTLGGAHAVIVDSTCPDPRDSCDAQSGDLAALAAAVWDAEGELSDGVQQVVEYHAGGHVLLLNRIEIDLSVRGHDLGLLCASEIIRVLARGCDVVATQAMPPQRRDLTDDERRRGRVALTKHWSRLGLVDIPGHEDDGMLVGDLSRLHIQQARARLFMHHGLPED